jgi:hypothetical protein
MGNGLVLACRVDDTRPKALAAACQVALTAPAKPALPRRPDRVLCPPGLGPQLARALGKALAPLVVEVPAPAEAEDIFDAFIGHMAGREQPSEPPSPEDWVVFFEGALAFYEAAPWSRWADTALFNVDVRNGPRWESFTALVLGHGGAQCGLVLQPGASTAFDDNGLGAGSLLLVIDPPGELPRELSAKALRYGWPEGSERLPALLSLDGKQPRDPAAEEAQTMTVALAAVVAHDARGLCLAGPEHDATTGSVRLSGGRRARFRVSAQAPQPREEGWQLHVAGNQLVRPGTGLVMGSTTWASLPDLRRRAKLHMPPPAGVPDQQSGEIPMIVVLADEDNGDLLAAQVASLGPVGVVTGEVEGRSIVALAGTEGSEVLMVFQPDDPALDRYRSRLKKAKGSHLVMVADKASATGEGRVYGLFECNQPLLGPG